MAETRHLPIDTGDLVQALEGFGGADYTTVYYLDLQTGDIFSSDSDVIEEMEAMAELVETQPERFEAIPTIEISEAYADMKAFIETVENRRLAGQLGEAIVGRGAFRRFRDTLARSPTKSSAGIRSAISAFASERWNGSKKSASSPCHAHPRPDGPRPAPAWLPTAA